MIITAAKKTIAVVMRAHVLLKGLNIFAKKRHLVTFCLWPVSEADTEGLGTTIFSTPIFVHIWTDEGSADGL
jgi:hypothetical protein